MNRVRFAPGPTGSLHVSDALSAVASRSVGEWLLLGVDDRGAAGIVDDLRWLGVRWDAGPVRRSERQERYREAAGRLGGDRFGYVALLRPDGTATHHLASVVDDADFGITHVLRRSDPDEELDRRLHEALGTRPPEVVHHGLVRVEGDEPATIAALRDAGIPAEAVRAYLEELGLPERDVRFDLRRIRRLALDAIAATSDEDLAARVGVPASVAPVLRGARDLREAREYAQHVLERPAAARTSSPETLVRFLELHGSLEPRLLVRELKAVGGDLRALRLALTGRDRGPDLQSVLAALPADEARRRVEAALR